MVVYSKGDTFIFEIEDKLYFLKWSIHTIYYVLHTSVFNITTSFNHVLGKSNATRCIINCMHALWICLHYIPYTSKNGTYSIINCIQADKCEIFLTIRKLNTFYQLQYFLFVKIPIWIKNKFTTEQIQKLSKAYLIILNCIKRNLVEASDSTSNTDDEDDGNEGKHSLNVASEQISCENIS